MAENETLQDEVQQQHQLLTGLHRSYDKKAADVERLHDIILQDNRESSIISDNDIEQRFNDLSYKIRCVVHSSFSGVDGGTRSDRPFRLKRTCRYLELESRDHR